jgi:hypothetical protein
MRKAGLFLAVLLLPLGLMAQSNEELMKQIEALKQQLQALEEKVATQQAAPVSGQKVEELDARLAKVETKTAGDNIQWGGDLRVQYDNQSWRIKPYQQVVGFDPMTGRPITQQVPEQTWSNPDQWSVRLRLKMSAAISPNLKFMGRLSMYKLYGGAGVPVFNGQPNTVYNSFNSVRVPSDDVLHVERALLRYDFPNAPFTLAFGRMNTSDGPPLEIKNETEREGTPMALMVNAEVDGFHADWHMDRIGLPEGTTFGICAGIGYESGLGGGGQVSDNYTMTPYGMGRINAMKDSTVAGFIFDMPLLFQAGSTFNTARFMLGYNRFNDMTDIPYGTLINFPIPGPYAFPAPQYVTATNNLGDLDQWGILWEHTINDKFSYFVNGGYIKSHPNGKVSQYGFGGLLGNPDHSETGSAFYAGLKWKPVEKVSLGLEYNHGSRRWFTYSPDAGDPSSKLAARGSVWEGYVHYFFTKNFLMKLGYTYYDYSTAFSGWHIAPGDLSYFNLDDNPVNFYAFPKTVKNAYLSFEARW